MNEISLSHTTHRYKNVESTNHLTMKTNEVQIILQNRINAMISNRIIASQMGNIEEVNRLDTEIEETQNTLNAL